MSIYWDEARQAYRWQFKAVIDGERHRLSRLLPRGWSETQAEKYDQTETARTYARLANGRRVSTVPLIETAVAHYLNDVVGDQRDGKHCALNLARLLPYYRGKGLDQLSAVAQAYAAEHKGELAPATIRQRLANLRSACAHAHKVHRLGTLDWLAIPMPAVDNARQNAPTRAEVLRIARACHDFATRALVLMTYGTGSRPGECHRAAVKGHTLVQEAKKGRVVKPVPVRLRRYLRHWPMQYGYTYHAKRWRLALQAVGLEHYHTHDLRHGTASALLEQGHSLATVGAVLDHASAQSTKRYTHMALRKKGELLEDLGRKKKAA
jgi:integrase